MSGASLVRVLTTLLLTVTPVLVSAAQGGGTVGTVPPAANARVVGAPKTANNGGSAGDSTSNLTPAGQVLESPRGRVAG